MSWSASATQLSSRIASLVHAHFDALPKRSKPTIFPDGSKEWIPMTGIVAVKGINTTSESLHCIALTTGAKCLSASQIPRCRGLVLHDCHAEILAIRAFNHWLLTECHGVMVEESLAEEGFLECSRSPFIRRRDSSRNTDPSSLLINWPPFEIQPDVDFYMYCTCAPCGDASMELCMAAQEDATPWEVVRPPQLNADTSHGNILDEDACLDGRAHFSRLGVVRRKPARTDAEATRSKSCSDKLALRQVSSLLSWETSRLVAPTNNAYLAGLVLPEDEITHVGFERCFGAKGRMKGLAGRFWPQNIGENKREVGYRFRPFQVLSVPAEIIRACWQFAKPKPTAFDSVQQGELQGESPSRAVTPKKSKPGNVSAVWTAAPSSSHQCTIASDPGSKSLPALYRSKTGLYETVINGVKQGNKASFPSARGASSLSRAKLWALLNDVTELGTCCGEEHDIFIKKQQLETDTLETHRASTYLEVKRAVSGKSDPLQVRREAIQDAKLVLKGWIPNARDENWGLDVVIDSRKGKR